LAGGGERRPASLLSACRAGGEVARTARPACLPRRGIETVAGSTRIKTQIEGVVMSCTACLDGQPEQFDFTMAFQPILDLTEQRFFAHEALVRGLDNEPAGAILSRVNDQNRYWFDQQCRMRAIEMAAELGIPDHLSINSCPMRSTGPKPASA
jgi:EAL domain-containing protein (putative c-di-GMP-specific phosphodiesterase class I)